MRTWGRVAGVWVEVSTDVNGQNDRVWLTTLIQTLKLNLGESPFWANYGIPAAPSVMSQVQPDYYMTRTQQQYAPYFAALLLSKTASSPDPVYAINVTMLDGTVINASVPVPQ